MPKNIKDILIDATKFPAAVEAKLPEGAPKVSEMLSDFAVKMPAIPDLPIDVPALPEPPALPEMPGTPPTLRRYITGAEVIPVPGLPRLPLVLNTLAKPLGEEILS